MRILEELWLGELSPIDAAMPRTKEYKKVLRCVIENQERLEKQLPQDAKQLLKSYDDAQIQLHDISERAAFSQGFCLGAKIMLAVLENGQI